MTQGREESEKKEDVGELGELFWCLWVFQSGHPVEKQWIMGKMEGKGRKKGEKHGALRGWKSGSLKKWRSDSLCCRGHGTWDEKRSRLIPANNVYDLVFYSKRESGPALIPVGELNNRLRKFFFN